MDPVTAKVRDIWSVCRCFRVYFDNVALSHNLIYSIPGENAIRLRGSPTFVRNFKGVLEDAAEQSREVIIGIAVPHRLHSDLRAKWFSGSFPQQTHTRIHFPGGSMEPVFVNNDPENLLELKGTDTKDIVRIYGTRKNCENGQKCLQVSACAFG